MPGRLARAWKAFRSPAEPIQQPIHVHVDTSLSEEKIRQLTAVVQRQLLAQAKRNRRDGPGVAAQRGL